MNRSELHHAVGFPAVLCVLACLPGEVVAQQKVFLAAGEVQPHGLREDRPLPPNTRNIIVGNGLVVVQESWLGPERRQCLGWVVISNNSWPVQRIATPGRCQTTSVPTAFADASQGRPLVAHMVFYGEGKADEPSVPAEVRQSRAERWAAASQLRQLGQQIEANERERIIREERERLLQANRDSLTDSARRAREAREQIVRDSQRFTLASELTGTWKDAALGATYYVRQIDNVVWWYGQSGAEGREWANVFHGVRDGPVIRGRWADVPRGTNRGSGVLVIQLDSTSLLRVVEQTGGFGTRELSRIP